MLEFILKWVVLSAAFLVTANVLPGVRLKGFKSSLAVAAIYGVLMFVVGKILFLVFSIGTLGVAYLLGFVTWWIIGAMMLLLTDKLTDKLKLDGLMTALIASGLLAVLTTVGEWAVRALLN